MVLLVAQAAMVLLLAMWITVAVRDNIIHADVNRDLVIQVLSMSTLKEEYPDIYESHAARSLTNPRLHRTFFGLIVLGELTAAALLWIGFGLLALACLGVVETQLAMNAALIGAMVFTVVWGGFLIGGNYWCYWMCHEGAQNTHFNLALLGLGTMIFLSA